MWETSLVLSVIFIEVLTVNDASQNRAILNWIYDISLGNDILQVTLLLIQTAKTFPEF